MWLLCCGIRDTVIDGGGNSDESNVSDNISGKFERLLFGDSYVKGTKKDSVCIPTGKDRSVNLLLEPTCLGFTEAKDVEQTLSDKVSSDIIMVTDGNMPYKWFEELRNIQHEQIPSLQHTAWSIRLSTHQ